MKFKKLLSLSTAFLVSASILTGCGSNKGTEKNDISVGIVLGAGSINDQSFNQSTWEGLQKAKADFGIEIKYWSMYRYFLRIMKLYNEKNVDDLWIWAISITL